MKPKVVEKMKNLEEAVTSFNFAQVTAIVASFLLAQIIITMAYLACENQIIKIQKMSKTSQILIMVAVCVFLIVVISIL